VLISFDFGRFFIITYETSMKEIACKLKNKFTDVTI